MAVYLGTNKVDGNVFIEGNIIEYIPTIQSGAELGKLSIDGVNSSIYAPSIPVNVSAFTNDAGYLTAHQDISGKQDILISGTNIKTINGNSILGSGNIEISGFLPLTGGAVTGQVNFTDSVSLLDATVGDLLVTGQASFVNNAAVATNTNYTNIQLRNIFFSTTVPASSTGNNGDICIVYTA